MKSFQIFISVVATIILILFCQSLAHSQEIDVNIIATIESNNTPTAMGKHGEIGLCQISPCVLKDFNKYNMQGEGLQMRQMFDPYDNKIVAGWYLNKRIPQMLRAYNLPITLDNILWAYNAGIGKVKKGILPKETKNYIAKYKGLTKGAK